MASAYFVTYTTRKARFPVDWFTTALHQVELKSGGTAGLGRKRGECSTGIAEKLYRL
jgi:hypothetical protein